MERRGAAERQLDLLEEENERLLNLIAVKDKALEQFASLENWGLEGMTWTWKNPFGGSPSTIAQWALNEEGFT